MPQWNVFRFVRRGARVGLPAANGAPVVGNFVTGPLVAVWDQNEVSIVFLRAQRRRLTNSVCHSNALG